MDTTSPTPDRTALTVTATATRPGAAAAAALAAAALAFIAYPMLRGSGSETGTAGAELYARDAWLIAHVLGMVGFVAAGWALTAVDGRAGRLAATGAVLVLPYYGAEAFGLHALGRHALETGDTAAIAAADLFRYEPIAMVTFAGGLALIAAAGVRLLLLVRAAATAPRLGLALVGLALATYLPQFFVPIEGRIAHGWVLGAGLLVVAWSARRGVPTTDGR